MTIMNITFYFLIFPLICVRSQDKLGLHCCPSIRISSTSFGRDHQPASMGNYNSMNGKINNRLVFKHVTGNSSFRNFRGFILGTLKFVFHY